MPIIGYSRGGAPPAVVTFNSADKSTSITLSGSDLIATKNAGGWGGVCATLSRSAGKRYFEITLNVTETAEQFGFMPAGHTVADASFDGAGADDAIAYGIGLDSRAGLIEQLNFTLPGGLNAYSCPAGTVVGVAVDLDGFKIWWSLDGSFAAVKTGSDPAAGTNPHATWGTSRTMLPTFWGFGATSKGTLAASGTFVTSPPSGFVAWNA